MKSNIDIVLETKCILLYGKLIIGVKYILNME